MRKRAAITVGVAALIAAMVIPTGGRGERLTSNMTGAQVVNPNGGDPDGSAKLKLRVNCVKERLCFTLKATGLSRSPAPSSTGRRGPDRPADHHPVQHLRSRARSRRASTTSGRGCSRPKRSRPALRRRDHEGVPGRRVRGQLPIRGPRAASGAAPRGSADRRRHGARRGFPRRAPRRARVPTRTDRGGGWRPSLIAASISAGAATPLDREVGLVDELGDDPLEHVRPAASSPASGRAGRAVRDRRTRRSRAGLAPEPPSATISSWIEGAGPSAARAAAGRTSARPRG